MAITDLRQTVLEIVNEVQRRIGVNATSTLTETKGARLFLQYLNDVVSECSDAGRWLELYGTVLVTAQSSVAEYTIAATALVHDVYEIRFGTDTSPLNLRPIEFIRRLNAKARYGTPRHFAMTGIDATTGQPKFSVTPVPTTAKTFDVAFYLKPSLYTTSDGAVVPPFPADVLIKGLFAKVLLDENGGEKTEQWLAAHREYQYAKNEALNRFTSDTGTDVQFVPGR